MPLRERLTRKLERAEKIGDLVAAMLLRQRIAAL